jgi:magnesium-transporting ATPase (P-type)
LYNEDYRDYTDTTIDHMEQFAKEGFRTLVLAYRIISEEDYQVFESFILSFFVVVEYIQIFFITTELE